MSVELPGVADHEYAVNGYLIGRFVEGARADPGSRDINLTAHDAGLDTCIVGAIRRGSIMS